MLCNGLESFLYLFFSEETYRRFIFVVIAAAVTNLKNSLFKAGLVPKPEIPSFYHSSETSTLLRAQQFPLTDSMTLIE